MVKMKFSQHSIPTSRQLIPEQGQKILLSDNVGFIRNLPHSLVESFKSTLDKFQEDDLLIHVVDVSFDSYEDNIRITK